MVSFNLPLIIYGVQNMGNFWKKKLPYPGTTHYLEEENTQLFHECLQAQYSYIFKYSGVF